MPVLGICYGMQLMSHVLGGEVKRSGHREYGQAVFSPKPGRHALPRAAAPQPGLDEPRRRRPAARRRASGWSGATETNAIAAVEDPRRRLYGMLFHPEVVHSEEGTKSSPTSSTPAAAAATGTRARSSRRPIDAGAGAGGARGRVICALSGGVDSAVAALLVHRAIGSRLTCVFVDNGLLRKDEAHPGPAPLRGAAAPQGRVRRRLPALPDEARGGRRPRAQAQVIGHEFIEVFKASMRKAGKADFLAQGTLYPDVIESTSVRGPSAVIKSHHNVGGLPKSMKFKLVEPLRELFKDEVRKAGLELGLDEEFVYRQPFPGPGPGRALPRAGHEGPARPAARGRRDLRRGDQGGGPLPQDLAVVRGPPAGALGGRHGRRPHLPVHDRPAGGRVAPTA